MDFYFNFDISVRILRYRCDLFPKDGVMERILVSACLMGLTVRYNGSDKLLISRTLLRQHGIEVFNEAQLRELIQRVAAADK